MTDKKWYEEDLIDVEKMERNPPLSFEAGIHVLKVLTEPREITKARRKGYQR